MTKLSTFRPGFLHFSLSTIPMPSDCLFQVGIRNWIWFILILTLFQTSRPPVLPIKAVNVGGVWDANQPVVYSLSHLNLSSIANSQDAFSRLQFHFQDVSVFAVTTSQEIDNGIVGEPEVKCSAEVVDLQFRTIKPFKGKVFVKGHYTDRECKVDYSDNGSADKPNGGIIIHHDSCDMQRQRMINPQGMQFSSVIVISFHPVFITKVDKAYHIKCMYRELEKTVTNGIEVSALTTSLISHTLPMPQCTYTIRKDEIDGEVMRYARVGEQVVHKWQCDTEAYGMLVHSCYVEDGQGEKVIVVNEHGCHTDRYILGDPTYVENLNMAYRESHVFKFADKVTVRFQCQIRLCLKVDDGCKGITPPICASPIDSVSSLLFSNTTRGDNQSSFSGSASGSAIPSLAFEDVNASSIVDEEVNRTRLHFHRRFLRDARTYLSHDKTIGMDNQNYETRSHFEPVDGDFTSQYIYVLDTTENPEKGSSPEQESWKRFLQRAGGSGTIVSEVHENVCMSTVTFSLLMATVTVIFMSAAFAAFVILFQRARRHDPRQHKSAGSDSVLRAMFGCTGAEGRRSISPTTCSSVAETVDNCRPPGYGHLVTLWNRGEEQRK